MGSTLKVVSLGLGFLLGSSGHYITSYEGCNGAILGEPFKVYDLRGASPKPLSEGKP